MRCGLDPEFNSFKEGGSSMSACKVFDEIPTSELTDWTEPNRVLEITIRHAYYPITNMVRHKSLIQWGQWRSMCVSCLSMLRLMSYFN
jgi:hypothetical protein